MDFLTMERTALRVDAGRPEGPTEFWRHGVGGGGFSYEPMPGRVVSALRMLKPRLVRVFLQEYFNIYPDHGVFDWSRLDAYMDAMAQTGAKVLATINIKPPVLFPRVGHQFWQTNDVEEYQNVIRALVRRYSVDRKIVTHWEHLNEPDIGEEGGCPFLITGAEENYGFYRMIIDPVLEVFPEAKVGGPAVSYFDRPMLKGFIELCQQNRTPLHFVSWHAYRDDSKDFARQTESVRKLLDSFGDDERPELMLNEMNKGFDYQDTGHPSYHLVSVEEQAYQGKRAAFLASSIISMADVGLDWSHYFHIWDCCMQPDEFARFYSPEGIQDVMYRHWNEAPTRFGLFSDNGRPRPQYFVYRLFNLLEGSRLRCETENDGLSAAASCAPGRVAVLLSNYSGNKPGHRIAQVQFSNLTPGRKRLTVYRVGNDHRWNEETLELLPVETRRVNAMAEFACQCLCPEDSVSLVMLEDEGEAAGC